MYIYIYISTVGINTYMHINIYSSFVKKCITPKNVPTNMYQLKNKSHVCVQNKRNSVNGKMKSNNRVTECNTISFFYYKYSFFKH